MVILFSNFPISNLPTWFTSLIQFGNYWFSNKVQFPKHDSKSKKEKIILQNYGSLRNLRLFFWGTRNFTIIQFLKVFFRIPPKSCYSWCNTKNNNDAVFHIIWNIYEHSTFFNYWTKVYLMGHSKYVFLVGDV